MRILGIDPGFATIGYGVIDHNGNLNTAVDYGVITTPKQESIAVRLAMIYDGINEIIARFQPDCVAVEELFFAKNVTTGIHVAHARGVILLACVHSCGRLYEYTPLQIKQALTGYGRAQKPQIQQMVKFTLGLEKIPRPDDAADALAVALTHSQAARFGEDFAIKGRI